MAYEGCSVDARALCVTGDGICSGKLSLLQQFETISAISETEATHGYDSAFDDDIDSTFLAEDDSYDDDYDYLPRSMRVSDAIKERMQIGEYDFVARAINCQNNVDGDCPSRLKMEASQQRTSVLNFLRKLKLIGRE